MGLYILNREQILIKNVPNRGLISLIQEEEINKADTLRAEIDLEDWKGSGDKLTDESFYMAVNDPYVKDDIHVYKISTMIEHVNHIELVGVNFAYDELKARRRIGEIVGTNYSARRMLEFITGSYGWEVGVVDDDLPTFDIDIRHVSHLDAIKYLIEHTGGEVNFRAKMINGKITERKIDFVKELSEFKGKRFALGSNLIDVVMEEDESELYTAIVGTGAKVKIDEDDPDSEERIVTLDEVEWSIANGDPVNKPLGMDYVEIPEATEKYGYADGSPRIGHASYSNEKNPENVLIMAYNDLLEASRPKKQFSATVDTIGEDMELGETVDMVKPGTEFRYKTRVFKIKRDYLDNNRTEVEFGDRLVTSTLDRLKLIKEEAVDDVKDDIDKSVRDAINQGIADGSIGGGGGGDVDLSEVYEYIDTFRTDFVVNEEYFLMDAGDPNNSQGNERFKSVIRGVSTSYIDRLGPLSYSDKRGMIENNRRPYLSLDGIGDDIALKLGGQVGGTVDTGESYEERISNSILFNSYGIEIPRLTTELQSITNVEVSTDDSFGVYNNIKAEAVEDERIEAWPRRVEGLKFAIAIGGVNNKVYYLITVGNGIFKATTDPADNPDEIIWEPA